jgi:protocatechuate 3,4-dioxygenase beta subunit
MHRTIRHLTLAVFVVASIIAFFSTALASPALGQAKTQTAAPHPAPSGPNAAIWGNVTDAHGSPLGGATVALLNEGSKETTSASTDGTGQYHFENLAPGKYTLSFTGSGMVAKQHKVHIKPGTKKVEVNERLKPPSDDK